MAVQWYIDWLTESGVDLPPPADDVAGRELMLLRAEYGEVPSELEELILAGLGHTGYARFFPFFEGADLPVLLPHDPTNALAESMIDPGGRGFYAEYVTSVAAGTAPTHPVFLASKGGHSYVVVECKGSRAGWVYDYDPLGHGCTPMARSLGECFGGFRRMADAGVLSFSAQGFGMRRSLSIAAPVPPLETPMMYAGVPQHAFWFPPDEPRDVLDGTVADVLGFEIPLAHDEPLGLRECFEPEGGWVAGRERVARLRTELGLDVGEAS